MKKTCLHRGEPYGKCKNCREDYEPISPTHPVNNYDCKNYYEIGILVTNTPVVTFNAFDKLYLTMGHLMGRDGDLTEELLIKKAKELLQSN
ncbi:MAG: hypothetical protein AABW47_00405 [Nanoarchaeota archaeon]